MEGTRNYVLSFHALIPYGCLAEVALPYKEHKYPTLTMRIWGVSSLKSLFLFLQIVKCYFCLTCPLVILSPLCLITNFFYREVKYTSVKTKRNSEAEHPFRIPLLVIKAHIDALDLSQWNGPRN